MSAARVYQAALAEFLRAHIFTCGHADRGDLRAEHGVLRCGVCNRLVLKREAAK